MVVADRADGVDVSAIIRADVHVCGREDLQVPTGRLVVLLEAVVGEEGEAWALVAGCHDAHVALDVHGFARPAFGHALRAVVEHDAGFGEVLDVAAQPVGFAGSDLVEHGVVYHWGFGEDAFAAVWWWGEVREVAVEKYPQKPFWDKTEYRLGAEDVEREKDVDYGVAGNDPSAVMSVVW